MQVINYAIIIMVHVSLNVRNFDKGCIKDKYKMVQKCFAFKIYKMSKVKKIYITQRDL